jgi:protein-tyrosine-phosphatase
VIAGVWPKIAQRLVRAYERRRMARTSRAQPILFVCLGNIIRSAFAAELLRTRSLGWADVRIRSAGLEAPTDGPAHPIAVQCARRFGVQLYVNHG